MPYVKALLTGFGTAIGAAVLWILISFILPVFGPMLIGRLLNRGGTSGAVIESGSILLAALVGFVIGTLWGMRRFVVAN
jgi:ABC-type multidrug transport system fused ATPase/permease subunit